jgi:hypothetical protein
MQPGRGTTPCYVPAFIGFGHLLRKDVFLALGGFRERFEFYGEEKDFCLRLLEAGYRTVYLPDARIVHAPDPAGRCPRRYLRQVTRNDCLYTLYNEPLHRLCWRLPARLFLYFRMRRHWNIADPWGWLWVVREIVMSIGTVRIERQPVSTKTLVLWGQLQNACNYATPPDHRTLIRRRTEPPACARDGGSG